FYQFECIGYHRFTFVIQTQIEENDSEHSQIVYRSGKVVYLQLIFFGLFKKSKSVEQILRLRRFQSQAFVIQNTVCRVLCIRNKSRENQKIEKRNEKTSHVHSSKVIIYLLFRI